MKVLKKEIEDEEIVYELESQKDRLKITYDPRDYGEEVRIIHENKVYKIKEWEADLVRNYGVDIDEL